MIKLTELQEELELKALYLPQNKEICLNSGFCSDMLSQVMASARPGQLWFTCQEHRNIIAVASLIELPAIVLVHSSGSPDKELIDLAREAGIALLSSDQGSFELAGKMCNLLTR